MSLSSMQIRRLPLHERHAALGAKFGAFGDWEVPLYYKGILDEHQAVRTQAGLFDISHMGEFIFEGRGAEKFLEGLLARAVAPARIGQAVYSLLLNERGGIVDDIILYRFAEDRFLMIVNAGNVDKDFRWIASKIPSGILFRNLSQERGLLALQGPASQKILENFLGSSQFSSLRYYHFSEWKSGMIARTGYTGEDGFEMLVARKELAETWDGLVRAGAKDGLVPAGFGARDTLRLEAGMLLHGHDMNEEATPLEAGLDWTICWEKSFIGRDALVEQKKSGIRRKLIGFEMIDRGIPRADYEIKKSGRLIGRVTSGSFSPTLQKNIGLGFVSPEAAAAASEIEIVVRANALRAKIVKLPFYQSMKITSR